MHNIITNFDQILDFAKTMNIPVDRKRGILREYLQSKFIVTLYSLPNSHKLAISGDTCLRFIKNINRFSEDLSFINLGISEQDVAKLFYEVIKRFKFEGFKVEFVFPSKEWRSIELLEGTKHLSIEKTHVDIKFLGLLDGLNISNNPNEVLTIRITHEPLWKSLKTESVLFNKYGLLDRVIAMDINQLLVQKLFYYLDDVMPYPKDIYDIIWLYAQGARVDKAFAKANFLENIIYKAKGKHALGNIPDSFKNKLAPFLFNFNDAKKLDLFELVLNQLI